MSQKTVHQGALDRFKHESLQDCQSVVRYLEALKDGFQNGALSFSTSDRRLTMHPADLVNLEVEAKRKGQEIKLTVKFRWNEAPEEMGEKTDLVIEPVAEK